MFILAPETPIAETTLMNNRRPVVIDLFAGAGGMSLGFEQAGFEVAAAVEIDPVHCAVHEFNFPNCTVIPQSVTELSGDEIRKRSGIEGSVSAVIGGAPCQGFSLIGKRILDDPRNSLVNDFVRIVCELDADYFVFENVKGLTVGKHRAFLEELIESFASKGYEVRKPWSVLNAASYGVPQSRQRLFLLGAKKGLTPPLYPAPSSSRSGKPIELGLPAGPSCKDALADLPDADTFSTLRDSDEVKIRPNQTRSDYAAEMRCETKEGWHFGTPRLWKPELLTSSIRTNHSKISQVRFQETEPGSNEPISRFFKLDPEGVSNTLRAGTDSARGAFTSPRPIHYKFNRCVTVREMARLHGFPDWFRLHRTKWHGGRQIGNSVPPPLARAVAASLREAMDYKPRKLSKPIELGDPKLLSLDMSQAARHFGIEAPIQKRDQKSGAKKRTQKETETERLAQVQR